MCDADVNGEKGVHGLLEKGPVVLKAEIRYGTVPARMTAAEASALIQSRKMSCEELVRSCLARIASRDSVVKAWLRLDPDYVIRRARELDKLPSKGPLHGCPGRERMSSTRDIQRRRIHHLRRVSCWPRPAARRVVRGSGSLILGKTDTVEFASMAARRCRGNPYNFAHTPAVIVGIGGSCRRFSGAFWGSGTADRRVAYTAGVVQRHSMA